MLEVDATGLGRVSFAGASSDGSKGTGWTLFLQKGWTVGPGGRAGDRIVQRVR